MKALKFINSVCLILMFFVISSLAISAQDIEPKDTKVRDRIAKVATDANEDKTAETDEQNTVNDEDKADDVLTQQDDKSDDTEDVESFYSNYMSIYRLGPEDVITVRVFGQCPDYCRENLTIPPTARISYPLIRGGLRVGGKTIQQLEGEITKKLDEYIIDPDVTVELVKVGSARYNVLGRVTNPGEHLMTRRISIFDAIAASGGISQRGEKTKVLILRPNKKNTLDPILINLKEIEEGKAEMAFLKRGDQVVVPKEGFKLSDIPGILGSVSAFRVLFGSPF